MCRANDARNKLDDHCVPRLRLKQHTVVRKEGRVQATQDSRKVNRLIFDANVVAMNGDGGDTQRAKANQFPVSRKVIAH